MEWPFFTPFSKGGANDACREAESRIGKLIASKRMQNLLEDGWKIVEVLMRPVWSC